jgi:O-antigen ligase
MSSIAGSTRRRLSVSWWDYIFVLLLIAISGNPVLARDALTEVLLLLTGSLVFVFYWLRVGFGVRRVFLVAAFGFVAIQLLQGAALGFVSPKTVLGFCVRLWIGYAVVRSVRHFPEKFVGVMTLLAAGSLLLWIPDRILPALGFDFRSLFGGLDLMPGTTKFQHVGVHTFMIRDASRNSGMFWEPGAFAGYLVLALLFLSYVRPRLSRRAYLRSLAILIVAVLSTVSTTGYLALPVVLILHTPLLDVVKTRRLHKLAVVFGVVAVGTLVTLGPWMVERSFLGPKLVRQYQQVQDRQAMWELTRYGSLIFDLEYISKRPLLGWGLHPDTRYSLHPGSLAIGRQGNGLSDFTVKLGLVGLTMFLALTAGSFLRMSSEASILRVGLSVVIVVMLLNGEAFLNYPLFLSLMFLPGVPKEAQVGSPASQNHRSPVPAQLPAFG